MALWPASEAVEESYFDDAVFIGDSRTEGLITVTGFITPFPIPIRALW